MSLPTDLYEARDGHVIVHVHVQPSAGRTAVVGRHGTAVKVRVGAPPTEGRANDAVVALLATTLGVAVSAVSVVSGATSRTKLIRVDGVDPDEVGELLKVALDAGAVAPPSRSAPSPHRRFP